MVERVSKSPAVLNIGVFSTIHQLEEQAMTRTNIISTFILITLMALFLGCASTAKQEGTGEYVDDTVITTKVKAAIFGEDSLKSAEINVETFKGVVQLSGFVNSQADINKAVQVARSVKGVISVKNSMRLK
jgi:osmotically-inducible protein OsmY